MAVAQSIHRPGFSPLLALLAPILGLLVYLNVLSNPLLAGERRLTVENPQVARPVAGSALWLAPTPADEPSHFAYRPVELLLWRAEYKAWGDSPSSFHSLNLILFISIIIAFGLLAGRLTDHPAARLAAMMTLALHPLATQSVQSVAGQGELLALLACLLAGYVLQLYRAQRLGWAWTGVLISLLTLMAVGSAELGLLLPVWLLAIAGLTRPAVAAPVENSRKGKKQDTAVTEAAEPTRPSLRWILILGLPLIVIVLSYLILRWMALGGLTPGAASAPALEGLLGGRFVEGPAIILLYLKRLLWPVSPTLFYSPAYEADLLPPAAAGWIVLLILIALTVWACRRRSRFGLALVLLMTPLLALAQWIPLSFFMSERPLVFALPGLGLLVGALIDWLAPQAAPSGVLWRMRTVLAVLCVAWLAMAWQTWTRGHDWKSAETL